MRTTLPSILAFMYVFVLASCTPAPTGQSGLPTKADQKAPPARELVIGAPVEPPSISALSVIGSHFPEHTPVHLLFDSLTQLKPDGSIGPKLAEKWAVSADGLTRIWNPVWDP